MATYFFAQLKYLQSIPLKQPVPFVIDVQLREGSLEQSGELPFRQKLLQVQVEQERNHQNQIEFYTSDPGNGVIKAVASAIDSISKAIQVYLPEKYLQFNAIGKGHLVIGSFEKNELWWKDFVQFITTIAVHKPVYVQDFLEHLEENASKILKIAQKHANGGNRKFSASVLKELETYQTAKKKCRDFFKDQEPTQLVGKALTVPFNACRSGKERIRLYDEVHTNFYMNTEFLYREIVLVDTILDKLSSSPALCLLIDFRQADRISDFLSLILGCEVAHKKTAVPQVGPLHLVLISDRIETLLPFKVIDSFLEPIRAQIGICWSCGLKQDRRKKCAGCITAVYCGPECQSTDWPTHKVMCKTLAQKIVLKNG